MFSVNMSARRSRRMVVRVAGALVWLWLQDHVPRGIGHVAPRGIAGR